MRPDRGKGTGLPVCPAGKRGLDTVPAPRLLPPAPQASSTCARSSWPRWFRPCTRRLPRTRPRRMPASARRSRGSQPCQVAKRAPGSPQRSVGGYCPGQEDRLVVCEWGPTDGLRPRPADLWPLPATVPWLVPPAVARGVRGWGGRLRTCFLESLEEAGEGFIPRTEGIDEVCPSVSVRTRGSLPRERFNQRSPRGGGRAPTHLSQPRQLTL